MRLARRLLAHRGYGHGLGQGHAGMRAGRLRIWAFSFPPRLGGRHFLAAAAQGCADFGCRVGERKRKRFARRSRGKHATLAGVMMVPWLPSTLLPCRTAQDRLRDRPLAGARERPSPFDAGIGGERRLSKPRAGSGGGALACSGPLLACTGPANGLAGSRRRRGRRGQISPGVSGAGGVSFLARMSVNRWE